MADSVPGSGTVAPGKCLRCRCTHREQLTSAFLCEVEVLMPLLERVREGQRSQSTLFSFHRLLEPSAL